MKIAAYCRVSTDKDEQLDSLNHQKEFFVEYAKRSGHELVRLYADKGISGTSLKKREEFKRLLRDAELGLFDMVVVKDISRFAEHRGRPAKHPEAQIHGHLHPVSHRQHGLHGGQ